MSNLIEVRGVSHDYDTDSGPLPVLRDFNIAVPEAAFCAVVGPSGCGKSTLTKLIAGLMRPDSGSVKLHGEEVLSPRGMRQRASLCRALVHHPEVLILDEPFGALDAFTREDLWQIMRVLRKEEQFTSVLITHDLRESVFLADQVVVMSGRPGTTQHVMDVTLGAERTLDDLYTAETTAMLAELRHQIQIAQGRSGDEVT